MNLIKFYHYKLNRINQNNRFNTIIIIDDVIVVNFDCIYERECGLRGVDQLIYQLHKLGQGRRFLFLSEDGANLKQSGAVDIIENVIKTFNLNKETCAVICREDITISNATVKNNESIAHWINLLHPTIKNITIPAGPFNKKFAVWFNRGTFYRLALARHLYENYKNDSIISYQETGILVDRKMEEYFSNDINWANTHTPIIYDQLFPNRTYTHEMIVGERHPYADYFIEIIAETDILSTNWITEKTVKNLYIGKPFIVMGGAGTIAKLQLLGFKTFNPWIDESYDNIVNIADRLTAIKNEIDRLAMLNLNSIAKEIMPILEYNRKHYENFISR